MSKLLPPNSSTTERRLADCNARISDIPVLLPTLMDADAIPTSVLPWLAWHMGVDAWKDYWSEALKRTRVRLAIPIARKNGTAAAVKDAVASFGADLALREWFELKPPGKPGTFEVVLNVNKQSREPTTAAFVQDIVREIDRTKPVRAHYTFTLGLAVKGHQGVCASARIAIYRRMQFVDKSL